MSIKITVNDALHAADALRELQHVQLPFKLAYRIGRVQKEIDSIAAQFSKERQKLFDKWGKPMPMVEGMDVGQAVPTQIKIAPEHTEEFTKTINEYLEDEVELPATILAAPMPISAFPSDAVISASILSRLQWMIEDDSE